MTESRKVLYVCLDPGVPVGASKGAAVHVWEMIRALDQEGHAVALVARNVVAAPASLAQMTIIGRPPRGRRLAVVGRFVTAVDRRRVRRQLSAALAQFGPDVVYERYALGHSPVSALTKSHGITHVLEVNAPLAHERASATGRPADPRAVATEHATWRAADLVVVPSHPLADMVRAAGQPQVLVTPNAVDPELFAPRDEPELPDSLGLKGRLVIGFSGTTRPWHDLGTVVSAVAQLPSELCPTLLIIGERPPAEISAVAKQQGVDLVVTGPVLHAAVPRYLAVVDVAVASLRPEPQYSYFSPLKALEYLAAGCPTIVADVGDLRALAECNVAVSYQAGDAKSLAAALQRTATDLDLRSQLRASGRVFAGTRTWCAVAHSVMGAVFDDATNASSQRKLVKQR